MISEHEQSLSYEVMMGNWKWSGGFVD